MGWGWSGYFDEARQIFKTVQYNDKNITEIFHPYKSEEICFSECNLPIFLWLLPLYCHDYVSQELNDAQRFNLSPIVCRTHGYMQSFFPRIISLWNSLLTNFSQKTTTYICLRRNATPTLLLDVICGSLKSEDLTQSIVLLKI